MGDNAVVFWENVKKEIKAQNTTHEWVAKKAGVSFNTFQGWISKGIFPRVNEAVRIAAALNTSVEYLVNDAVRDNTKAIKLIFQNLPKIEEHLNAIREAVKELQ
jgi:transcriptional regulator with XRE-family HTH domain